jgi:hypothetical protein
MLALGILPLTLSMGFAELELRKHEAAIRVALGREHDLTGFARAASRILLAATARYVSALTALSALVLVSVAIAGRTPWQQVPLLGAYLLLGAALFLGLVMAATGNVTTVVASLAGAVTVVAVFQGLAGTSVEQSFTVGCAGLLSALALDAFHGVKQVGNHR